MMKRHYLIIVSAAFFTLAGMAMAGSETAGIDTPSAQSSGSASGGLLELPGAPPAPAAAPPPSVPQAAPPIITPHTVLPPMAVPPSAPVASPVMTAPPPVSPPAALQAPVPAAPQLMTPPPSSAPQPPVAAQPLAPATAPVTAPQAPAPNAFSPSAATPPAPAPAPPAPGPQTNSQAMQQATAQVYTKNPDTLFTPLHLPEDASLMFNKSDMSVLIEALAVYDKSSRTLKSDVPGGKDDLSTLLNSLKTQKTDTPAAPPPPLPNIYLGSIVYYSPFNWSIWINGKKLTNRTNQPGMEFHVTRLSRGEAKIIWKPLSLLDTPAAWQRLTDNGAKSLPHITVNENNGTITMELRPNQTFIPHALAIREGLIKSSQTVTTVGDAANESPPVPAVPAPPPAHGNYQNFNQKFHASQPSP